MVTQLRERSSIPLAFKDFLFHIVKTQRNSTLKQLALELDIEVTCSTTHHPTTTTNFSATSRPARELDQSD